MKPEQLTWSVSDQLQETCAGSSLGFRGKEKEYDAAQDEKGGWTYGTEGEHTEHEQCTEGL